MTEPALRDRQLLDRLRRGDGDAFEALFRSYYPDLLRFATSHLGDREAAEDAVHDVFLRIWRDRETIGGDRSLRVYLLAAVRNRVIDVVRHRAIRGPVFDLDDHAVESGLLSPIDPRRPLLASDEVELNELRAALEVAVTALPERCRTAFILCREQGLTYAQAAEVMGVSPATVKTQIARALTTLRSALEPFLALLLATMAALR